MARVMTSGMVKTLKMIELQILNPIFKKRSFMIMGNPQPSPKFIFIFFKNRYKYGCSSETKWKLALYYIILCLRYSPFQLERVVLRRNVL